MYPNTPPIKELRKFGNTAALRLGSNDFKKPIIINGKVNSFGIMKCFKSIKKMIIKLMLNIKSKSVVIEKPNRLNIITKLSAEINSTKKYLELIFAEQLLHLAFRIIKDINGMLSYHFINFLQDGQKERPLTTLKLSGIL